MADENAAAPDQSPEVKDSDFTIESASAPLEAAPDDTTVRDTPQHQQPVPDDEQPPADDEKSAAAAKADAGAKPEGAKPAAGAKAPKKKPGLEDRERELRARVDRATYELRETERKIEEKRRELQSAGKPADAKPAADAPAAKPAATEMPEPPNYRDFDTDEAYEAAKVQWRKDVATWQAARETSLKDDITKGVDARFSQQDQVQAETRRLQTVGRTIETVKAKYQDWDEKREALADIQSSWYEAGKHGTVTTPFLSDLSFCLLAEENPEGGELLYFLGSDPARAQVLADLQPSRALRDALVSQESILPLLEHFATDAGQQEFDQLRRMPNPVRCIAAVGALSARLAAAPRGSAPAAHTVTKAQPSVKPPVGAPGARGAERPNAAKPVPFEQWMADEDAKEAAERNRLLGIAG